MNARSLGIVGLWGALLTGVILAMSVLLRLGTRIEAGEAVSLLPAGIEFGARVAHRIAAMAVGVLAALALLATVREPHRSRRNAAPALCIVALTLVLASVGRYTPGYRIDFVTVVNVVGGVGLIASFWWLRARSTGGAQLDYAALAALVLLLALAALGAAVDASAMRGERFGVTLHQAIAAAFLALVLLAAWRGRRRRAPAVLAAVAAVAQFALGFLMLEGRPVALAWAHAMTACLLAAVLVSLAVRPRPLSSPPHRAPRPG